MRIISGKYKGKKILGDNIDGTRPTMDRVKESLFGTIQNKINDSICLDLFAGSGSLGIEALSNGAQKCYFVDKNKIVIDVLKKNTNNVDNALLIYSDYISALKNFKENNIKFDIIFLDPPYNTDYIDRSINLITKYDLLNEDGIIVCESNDVNKITVLSNYQVLKSKKYGEKMVIILKKNII